MGSGYSGAVLDVGSGRTLFAHKRTKTYIPASTMKLLTSAAALSILGPDRTFTTKVVSGSGRQIILVGGGDPYLESKADKERASLADLARATAAALRKQKVRKVSLGYDDSLFSGPRWNPTWPSGYRDVVTPISALWVDEGRIGGIRGPGVEPEQEGRRGLRRRPAQTGDHGELHRRPARPGPGQDRGQRVLDAAGPDRRGSADGQRQRRRRGRLPPGRRRGEEEGLFLLQRRGRRGATEEAGRLGARHRRSTTAAVCPARPRSPPTRWSRSCGWPPRISTPSCAA